MNGLLSYPGIYPNVYIVSHVIPGIYAAAVAKCSKVMFHRIKQWMLKVLRQLFFSKITNEKIMVRLMVQCVLWSEKYGNMLGILFGSFHSKMT